MASGKSHFLFVGMFVIYLADLEVDMEAGAVLPPELLDTYLACRNSGAPDAAMSGLHQSDGNPTPDIPACPGVGLPPLGGKMSG